MRKFNLEEAKAGKPVCTRDGKDARIEYIDSDSLYPIVARIVVDYYVGRKCTITESYNYDGSCINKALHGNRFDLMMKEDKL